MLRQMMITRMRPPLFPLIPFLFPIWLFFVLMGLTALFSYRSYRELEAIRRAEETHQGRQLT